MEFDLPTTESHKKDIKFERIRDSHTETYTGNMENNCNFGEKVSDLSYVVTSTPEPSKKRKRETFEDICDGTYIYYLCIFRYTGFLFHTMYFFNLTYLLYFVFFK